MMRYCGLVPLLTIDITVFLPKTLPPKIIFGGYRLPRLLTIRLPELESLGYFLLPCLITYRLANQMLELKFYLTQ